MIVIESPTENAGQNKLQVLCIKCGWEVDTVNWTWDSPVR